MLTAIIVDDELHGRENLKKLIETYCPELKILALASSVLNAIEMVNVHNPDVVFLDINMPVLDGFDFLKEYDSRTFQVVFVTAHDDYGINAVKAGAVDYLLKPINIKELKQTVKKLVTINNQQVKMSHIDYSGKVVIPATNGFEVLFIDDIIRIEAEGCYTKVIVKTGKIKIVSRTLKDFEEGFLKDNFFRVHKSHLINIKYIKGYSIKDGNYVTMIDDSRIEVSRRKAADFIKRIKNTLNSI